MSEKSFQLIRTNPSLTTNYKLVVDSNYKLYLESFDSNSLLSQNKYKHYLINKDNYLSSILPKFYANTPSNIAYDIKYSNDSNLMYSTFDNQFDDIYYGGPKNVEDTWYTEEYEYLAPLYIEKNTLPSNFVILRVDDPNFYYQLGDNYNLGDLNSENFRSEIIDKWKCVSIFDMTIPSNLGYFLDRNITSNDSYPVKSLEFDIKNNTTRFYGIDYTTGEYTEKDFHISDFLTLEYPHYHFEKFMTSQWYKNGVIYPHILNLKFLFDDTPATPDKLKKWTINRYYGFYMDSKELVTTLTSYKSPTVISGLTIYNNIFKIGDIALSGNPFSDTTWSDTGNYYIYVGDDIYPVKKQNNQYVIISDNQLNISDLKNNNNVTITYNSANGKSYITGNDLIIDPYFYPTDSKDMSAFTSNVLKSMFSDLYVIEIDNKYHILKCENNGTGFTYYIQTDYAINSNTNTLEYWINTKNSDYYVSKNISNSTDKPLTYPIYRLKFSDIKDFDYDRVNTHYADFDYEKEYYYETPEHKLYTIEYRDNSLPKSFKVHEKGEDGEYKIINVSSEYIASDELFEISKKTNSTIMYADNTSDLSDIWRKNQCVVKWGFQSSISHCDYPYKLNNSSQVGSDNNRTVNLYSIDYSIVDKSLDYFYRIGSFISGGTSTNPNIYRYYNQSTNIETELYQGSITGNTTTWEKFDISEYLSGDIDYFDYFFNNKMNFTNYGQLYKKSIKKYSVFSNGDDVSPSSALFKGLKIELYSVDDVIYNGDYIEKFNCNNANFDNYRISILLNDITTRTGVSSDVVSNFDNTDLLYNSGKTGIHVMLNDKFKNILIIIDVNLTINMTDIDINNIDIFGENIGLYDGVNLNKTPIVGYNSRLLTATNFIRAINEWNDNSNFDQAVTYYYVDMNGVSGYTSLSDIDNSTLDDTSWGKKIPPFLIDVVYPDAIFVNKPSFSVKDIKGPQQNIYNSYITYNNGFPDPNTVIRDSLSREIVMNTSNNFDYSVQINRFSGQYEPIFKDIDLFNVYTYWYQYKVEIPAQTTYDIKIYQNGSETYNVNGVKNAIENLFNGILSPISLECLLTSLSNKNIYTISSFENFTFSGDTLLISATTSLSGLDEKYPIVKSVTSYNRNNKFDTDYYKFGMIEELMYSKVNPEQNVLKLKNSVSDKSIYPKVDECGLSVSSRFIFKSTWDKEFFI